MLRILTALCLGFLFGCQGFYPGVDGVEYDVWTYGDAWSPSFTAILKDGEIVQVIAGEGGVAAISTGAGIAIGAAVLDSGDTTNVSGTGGSSAASSVSGATIIGGQ